MTCWSQESSLKFILYCITCCCQVTGITRCRIENHVNDGICTIQEWSRSTVKSKIMSPAFRSVPGLYDGTPRSLISFESPTEIVSRSSSPFWYVREVIILESQCNDACSGGTHISRADAAMLSNLSPRFISGGIRCRSFSRVTTNLFSESLGEDCRLLSRG